MFVIRESELSLCALLLFERRSRGLYQCKRVHGELLSNRLSIQAARLKESPRLALHWSILIRQYSSEILTINVKSCFPLPHMEGEFLKCG